jgi:hypothetical protein
MLRRCSSKSRILLGVGGEGEEGGMNNVSPDSILAVWRSCLVWCQISQTTTLLLMSCPRSPCTDIHPPYRMCRVAMDGSLARARACAPQCGWCTLHHRAPPARAVWTYRGGVSPHEHAIIKGFSTRLTSRRCTRQEPPFVPPEALRNRW